MRGRRWRWLGIALASLLSLYALSLVLISEGECGRDSPFFFGAEASQSFITFGGGFGPEFGTETVEDAAVLYARDLLGVEGYELIPVENGVDQSYEIRDSQNRLIGGFTVQETEHGRYFVGGHTTCVQHFQSFLDHA